MTETFDADTASHFGKPQRNVGEVTGDSADLKSGRPCVFQHSQIIRINLNGSVEWKRGLLYIFVPRNLFDRLQLIVLVGC
jgi:hypothetical protein